MTVLQRTNGISPEQTLLGLSKLIIALNKCLTITMMLPALLLAGQATHKQEYKIFDTGASQNFEKDRS